MCYVLLNCDVHGDINCIALYWMVCCCMVLFCTVLWCCVLCVPLIKQELYYLMRIGVLCRDVLSLCCFALRSVLLFWAVLCGVVLCCLVLWCCVVRVPLCCVNKECFFVCACVNRHGVMCCVVLFSACVALRFMHFSFLAMCSVVLCCAFMCRDAVLFVFRYAALTKHGLYCVASWCAVSCCINVALHCA